MECTEKHLFVVRNRLNMYMNIILALEEGSSIEDVRTHYYTCDVCKSLKPRKCCALCCISYMGAEQSCNKVPEFGHVVWMDRSAGFYSFNDSGWQIWLETPEVLLAACKRRRKELLELAHSNGYFLGDKA